MPCEIHLVSVATSLTEVSWEGELSFSFGPNVHGYLPTCSFSRTCTCTHSSSITSHNMEKGRRRWVGRVGNCQSRSFNPQSEGADCTSIVLLVHPSLSSFLRPLIVIEKHIPYARHYNPRFVLFLAHFSFSLRFILQTTYVLKTKILHFLSLKSAVYIRERFLIKSGL